MPRSNLRFALISLVVLFAVGACADAALAVTLADPTSGNYSHTISQIGADGTAFPNQEFTVQLKDTGSGTVVSYCDVTADSNGNWLCNLPAPAGGFLGGHSLVAECVDDKGTVISNQNTLTFY